MPPAAPQLQHPHHTHALPHLQVHISQHRWASMRPHRAHRATPSVAVLRAGDYVMSAFLFFCVCLSCGSHTSPPLTCHIHATCFPQSTARHGLTHATCLCPLCTPNSLTRATCLSLSFCLSPTTHAACTRAVRARAHSYTRSLAPGSPTLQPTTTRVQRPRGGQRRQSSWSKAPPCRRCIRATSTVG